MPINVVAYKRLALSVVRLDQWWPELYPNQTQMQIKISIVSPLKKPAAAARSCPGCPPSSSWYIYKVLLIVFQSKQGYMTYCAFLADFEHFLTHRQGSIFITRYWYTQTGKNQYHQVKLTFTQIIVTVSGPCPLTTGISLTGCILIPNAHVLGAT